MVAVLMTDEALAMHDRIFLLMSSAPESTPTRWHLWASVTISPSKTAKIKSAEAVLREVGLHPVKGGSWHLSARTPERAKIAFQKLIKQLGTTLELEPVTADRTAFFIIP